MKAFEVAERYIQLRRKWAPKSRADVMQRINDLILSPLITIFLLLSRQGDLWMAISGIVSVFFAWKEWLEYQSLRFQVQHMFLHTAAVGGPFIRTNDPEYMPYVFADAVYRVPVGIGKPAGGKLDG
jgi:hypothetical protein